MTNDGRYLTIREISTDHLHNIQRMLLADMPQDYDQTAGRELARRWMNKQECLLDYTIDWGNDFDLALYAAAWLQFIEDELAQRASETPQGKGLSS